MTGVTRCLAGVLPHVGGDGEVVHDCLGVSRGALEGLKSWPMRTSGEPVVGG